MATRNTNQTLSLDDHKRKLFFEYLSPDTTTESLGKYLSGYELERCVVPRKDGKNQSHGLAVFRKESSVNNLMSKRPHRIDGRLVEIYRSVPDQGSLKEKKGSKILFVSGLENGSLSKSDLDQHFSGFGTIKYINMADDGDCCVIEFDDYDSVDKALLDIPHIIKRIEVSLKKGDRNTRLDSIRWPKTNQTVHNNNNNNKIPRKSIIKQVQIDPQISSLNLPKKCYCIHIKNLPSAVDAETLSIKFKCFAEDILVSVPLDNQSSTIECWLKNIEDLDVANRFVQRWDGQIISGSEIECEVEEDKLELCNKFRIGNCQKRSDVCDWEHIMCTADGKCSSNCPYGHDEGTKTGHINDSRSTESYRIKITGFQKKLTDDILASILRENKCFVSPNHDRVGYIFHIKTMKYARRLMSKWHNKEIDGQKLQCQIELDPRSFSSQTLRRSGSMSNLEAKENDSHRIGRSQQQLNNNNRKNTRDASVSKQNSDPEITVLDDLEINNEGNLFGRSRDDIIKQRDLDTKYKVKSTETLTSSNYSKSQTPTGSFDDIRKMSMVRKKTDHGSLAFLVEYNNTEEKIYFRELQALKLLKGVQGVIQLIELNDRPYKDNKQYSSNGDLSLLTEHTAGCSLKEFVKQSRGGFGILEAIQLVQNLTTIVKEIHFQGVFHQNLGPGSIMIEWDSKQTSIDQAQLILIDFSQADIKSDIDDRVNQSTTQRWYKAPQSNVESLKYISTIDASNICAILFWLLTNTNPRHENHLLPHQQNTVMDKLDAKIMQAVRNANVNRNPLLEAKQLKTYLTDTFNIGFGYPEHEPWTISGLECRLESIRELLLSRDPKLITTDDIFKNLISTFHTTEPVASTITNVNQDIFQKASIAFQEAKRNFVDSMNDQYTWSDGSCTWIDNAQTLMNERQHDDILTYYCRDRHMSSSCSIIISCLATLIDEGNRITLSIGSVVNGKISRIPIGHYNKNENYIGAFKRDFVAELNNLIKSIAKERRTMLQ